MLVGQAGESPSGLTVNSTESTCGKLANGALFDFHEKRLSLVIARGSVQSLAALSPDVVVTGHGQAKQGLHSARHCTNLPNGSTKSLCRDRDSIRYDRRLEIGTLG